MRTVWLTLALLPFACLALADGWIHERGRRVPRLEQWLHGALALSIATFIGAAYLCVIPTAWAALGVFVFVVALDELGYHRGIARRERMLHFMSWAALALFVVVWLALGCPSG